MDEVTQILTAIERSDVHTASQLLPLVYNELRQLASQRLAREAPGQTLQPIGPGSRGLRPARRWGRWPAVEQPRPFLRHGG
jgi:hypothetical protein